MKKVLFLLWWVSACCLSPLWAAEKDTEINLISEEWEGGTNKDGTGLYWDIFRKIYEPAGIKVNYRIQSYVASVKLVQQEKFDALVGAYLKEIEGLVYPKFPFGADQVTAVFLKNANVNWQGELSLEGQRVGWIQGYSYDKYLRYKVQKTELSRRDHGFSQLKSERLDFYLDAAEDIKRELQRESLKSEPTPYRTEPLMKLSLYLVFTNNDRGKRLAKIFDERMALLIQSGELKALYDKAKYIDYPF